MGRLDQQRFLVHRLQRVRRLDQRRVEAVRQRQVHVPGLPCVQPLPRSTVDRLPQGPLSLHVVRPVQPLQSRRVPPLLQQPLGVEVVRGQLPPAVFLVRPEPRVVTVTPAVQDRLRRRPRPDRCSTGAGLVVVFPVPSPAAALLPAPLPRTSVPRHPSVLPTLHSGRPLPRPMGPHPEPAVPYRTMLSPDLGRGWRMSTQGILPLSFGDSR